MLVSWDWLSEYVRINIGHEQMATRWALTGLNHESTQIVDGVPVIDLEVTSNRGDCLGHIGIAREASVLLNTELRIPAPKLACVAEPISKVLGISNEFPAACPKYTGRVIRGVKVGPSPEWLRKRLNAIGVKSINNVVDATNYVMFECGQPLHAFDLQKIRGGRIVVRPAHEKETFVAIDHKTYQLDTNMVVIADAERAVALGGVMGGVDSEVSASTLDVLLEAADFVPLSIRRTARKLKLHSPSSYRYERKVDGARLDWASQRCCELILQLAGGQLLSGVIEAGNPNYAIRQMTLRKEKISDVLGIDIPWNDCIDILKRLGCTVERQTGSEATIIAPSFRHDLSREIDLIEEIARIHGYEQIPEDVPVPLVASVKRPKDVIMGSVRNVACAAGFHETMTPSLVAKSSATLLSPWTEYEPLSTQMPLLEGANTLRRSLIPSLIQARLYNQAQSSKDVCLFETANVYLPRPNGLPAEQWNLGMIGTSDLRVILGAFEEMLDRVCGKELLRTTVTKSMATWNSIAPGSGIVWSVGGHMLAWAGLLARSTIDTLKLDGEAAVGEMNLDLLLRSIRLVPQLEPVIPFPTIVRDLNFIVEESVTWQQLSTSIQRAAGPLCIGVQFREIYRDPKKDGENMKRVLLTLLLRSSTETLTSERADAAVQNVLDAAQAEHNAKLLQS